jgi:hypothetical protein
MHRRTLTLRRFGPLSFGLGYVEDGQWVDHAAGDLAVVEPTDRERAAIDAIHAWFGCCGAETDAVALEIVERAETSAMAPQVVRSASS